MAFASISTDLYLPAMPAMQTALHAGHGAVEMTISGYLVGFSLGQLLWGPIGDRYGRRLPIAVGLVLFIIGSAGCATSDTVTAMVAWRALQAVGACASVVLARAIVRDLYQGARAAQMMSTLITVMAIAPLVGPSAGGLILHAFSWRAIFWTLVALGALALAALHAFPETLPAERRAQEPLQRVLSRYAALLRHPRLLAYSAIGAFFYAGVYAYIAATPFAYIEVYHVSPQHYGLLFAIGIAGIMIANQFNARWVARWGSDRLVVAGTAVAAVSGLWAAIDARTGWGGLTGLAVPLFVFVSANGLIVANSITGALETLPRFGGSISALVGAIQYGSGILGSALVGAWSDGTAWPLGAVMGLSGLGCLLSALLLVSSSPVATGKAAACR
jgi:DHA1 family bicyclomycin/chloramphenicol resistance-like MFS transporter